MGQESGPSLSSRVVDNLWWMVAIGGVTASVFLLAYFGDKSPSQVSAVDQVSGERAVGTQVADQSDAASAQYAEGVATTPSELPSWISEDKVFGQAVLCGILNTGAYGNMDTVQKDLPIIDSVSQVLRELGDQIYLDNVLVVKSGVVELRKMSEDREKFRYDANNTRYCVVPKPLPIPIIK